MEESWARAMGLSNQPLLSLAMREGNPDEILMRLARESSSWVQWWSGFWIREEEEEEEEDKWAECWSLRVTQVSKRKIKRRKGKAWGFLRNCIRDEKVRPCKELSEFWFVFEYELLLGFAIIPSFFSQSYLLLLLSVWIIFAIIIIIIKGPYQLYHVSIWSKNVFQSFNLPL